MSAKDDKKPTKLLDDLEAQINKLLISTMRDSEATLTDKMKVIDRGLKLAQIKAKIDDEDEGSSFNDD